ncbi:MAG: protein-L-isoaspartate O-methyltransferase [Bacteroidetes bacterium GWE2_41_25]|nr:MAG: protein-L-isoaspartate O-methyltransferase [Bacteroidetes bacterium GWA2_40_15]OFX93931.1 MAG: protein-L-isoaspartate O-methyltransferase [Bacteroidetes bacterium GWE2_41_25]OFY00866.1 MAG: protein-L-isoaspartate O-methyltransferase [Bacteroidetes bacterium GWC2_40_22]OFY60008.1 MAG: protein-L-isoaspartate O-methyltransferase [Bacteroidetes bacterium GWF2_41_9]HAM10073.1 protein-L-isoaspartate O-methyltransferase [Bacteroidales bacterium]
MTDSFEAKGRRKRLVAVLRQKGITDEEVLRAIDTVPRHLFMDPAFLNHAYIDKAFPLSSGQTISQPYTVAVQTSLLRIKKRDKILEVGTGSGYQAAVLAEMGAKVYTIERYRDLFLKAQKTLISLGYEVDFFYGDGYEGKSQYGPFDGIIVTAAAPEVPSALLQQLKNGGRLVIPIGGSISQVMTVAVRTSDNTFEYTDHGNFIFVPMLKGTVNAK